MREKELQDYLYEHPELLFPGRRVQEKTREYTIHGRRIDLLYVVDGVRYIVELKGVPLQRDHIGQIVEYYGLMKRYLSEANLRMILVSPSIPAWRGKYLEELGIRCVELPGIPEDSAKAGRVARISRESMRREESTLRTEAALIPGDRLTWDDAIAPANTRTSALARRFLRDSLETIRTRFAEYEIVPYGVTRGHVPDIDVQYDEATGSPTISFRAGGIWWAYRFGHSQKAPPNDIPNISVMAHGQGIEVTVNAELQPSQAVLRQRIRSDPEQLNRILRGHAGLALHLYLKYEHQPRFYHWIPTLRKAPGEFDAGTVLDAYDDHGKRFAEERAYWIDRIIRENINLTDRQRSHLERSNQSLNLATRFSSQFLEGDPFWGLPYEGQVKRIAEAAIRLKPLLDFLVEDQRR